VNDLELDTIRHRLANWGRWTRDHPLPNLDVREPSFAAYWAPSAGWDAGWGEEGPPDARPTPVYDRDAEITDKLIQQLPHVYKVVIVRHYHLGWRQAQLDLDQACRMLLDRISDRAKL
jgi:hypothetical protein